MKPLTIFDLFRCFNVALPVKGHQDYWLWKVHKKPEFRSNAKTRLESANDTIRPGVTTHPRGSLGRLEDLRRFYENHPTETPFVS